MSGKYSFSLQSSDKRRDLPRKLIIGQQVTELPQHVLLKMLGFLLFFRDRLQIEPRLHDDNIPYRPDLVHLDYELRPRLWVECGECSVQKLDRLAVKVPVAEIWVMRPSPSDVEVLMLDMRKHELRKDRYNLIGFNATAFEELGGHLHSRNNIFWVGGGFDPPLMQFDFNGLWFDLEFEIRRF